MNLNSGEVLKTLRELESKRIVLVEQNFKTQVEKFTHRFCNTAYSDYQFDSAQYAIICVLLLRGSRTPGELRANCARLHAFADNEEVVLSLQSLINAEKPCVAMLARAPGRRDNEYTHLFFGTVKSVTQPVETRQSQPNKPPTKVEDLEQRIVHLETAVAELQELLK